MAEEKPVIGEKYRGSVVVDITEERSERPNGMLRIRKAIQLDSGMILVEDEFQDNRVIEGDYKELEYKEIVSPMRIDMPKKSNSKRKKKIKPPPLFDQGDEEEAKREAEEKARKEAEEEARRQEEERLALQKAQEDAIQREKELQEKKEAEEKAALEEEERQRKEAAEAEEARREAERRKIQEAEAERLRKSQEAMKKRKEEADRRREEARKRAERAEKWQPLTMCVRSPESNIQRKDKSTPPNDTKATWMISPVTEHADDFDWWKPQDVVIYPPGKGIPAEKKIDRTSTPNGLWAYAPGTDPDEDGDDWNPRGGAIEPEILVFPPGVSPSDVNKDFKVGGEWVYPEGEKAFPPLPTPKNEWSPTKVQVHPKSKVPTKKNSPDDGFHGVWKISDGNDNIDMGDDNWRVAEIQVYPQGQEPNDLQNSKVQGVWGLAPGARPDENGEFKPEDLWFFGPGDSPPSDEDWNPQGIWTHTPESKREDWPPLSEPRDEWEPKAVWVVPPTKVSDDNDEDWQATGVWNFGESTPSDAEDWKPYQVTVYPEGKEPENLKDISVQGVWGLSADAKHDHDGNWKASDVIFVGPGDEPPEDWRPQGIWTVSNADDSTADDDAWPPSPASNPVVEPKDDWGPRAVWVVPPSKIDNDDEEWQPTGVWNFSEKTPDDAEAWKPYQVIVHPEGKEPDDLEDCKVHGVWGLSPNAQPDDEGEWKVSDIIFIAPGEEPPEDWRPQGVWTVSPSSEDDFEDWPPQKVEKKSTPEPKENWEPKAIWVVPPSKLEDDDEDWHPTGVWNFGGEAPEDVEDWQPYQVTVHPEGKEPDHLEDFKVHGVWGLSPEAEPDDEGEWKASDLIFVPPGEEPPEDWRPQGVWTVSPTIDDDNEEWPPSKFPGKGEQAMVYPKSKVPDQQTAGALEGVWAVSGNADGEDEDWAPKAVILYKGELDPKKGNSDELRGMYGYGPDAKPDENGNYSPKDLWFCMPGQQPEGDEVWSPMGTWEYAPESTKRSKKNEKGPRTATVYPRKKLPAEVERGVEKGVWSYTPGKKVMDAGKKPMKIKLYEKGEEPEELPKQNGAWGYAPNAKPDKNGDYLPSALWIFAAGETPPDDGAWQPMGTWTEAVAPKKVAKNKPNAFGTSSAISTTSATKKPLTRQYSKSAWVYLSPETAPAKGEEENPQGCWNKCPGGSNEEPQELLIYDAGHEPPDLAKLPHGTFGYAPGSKPDENGVWSPKDMRFFGPDEDIPSDLQHRGTWTYPHGSRREITTWYSWEGDQIINFKKTEIFFMDTVTSFTVETKG